MLKLSLAMSETKKQKSYIHLEGKIQTQKHVNILTNGSVENLGREASLRTH